MRKSTAAGFWSWGLDNPLLCDIFWYFATFFSNLFYLGDKIYKYDNFSKRNVFFFFKKDIYLALPSLSRGMWDLVP